MKRIFFIILSVIVLQSSHAQVQAGLKAGLNLANVYVDGDNDSRARAAFYAGGLLHVSLANNLFFQPEAQYSIKGKRTVATAAANEATLSLNYITVPLLLGYRYNRNFAFAIGPEFGFLTSANSKFNGMNNDVSAFYRKFDAGADLNLDFSFAQSVGLNVRYNIGIKDLQNAVFTDANGNITGQGKVGANRVLQIGLFYILPK